MIVLRLTLRFGREPIEVLRHGEILASAISVCSELGGSHRGRRAKAGCSRSTPARSARGRSPCRGPNRQRSRSAMRAGILRRDREGAHGGSSYLSVSAPAAVDGNYAYFPLKVASFGDSLRRAVRWPEITAVCLAYVGVCQQHGQATEKLTLLRSMLPILR